MYDHAIAPAVVDALAMAACVGGMGTLRARVRRSSLLRRAALKSLRFVFVCEFLFSTLHLLQNVLSSHLTLRFCAATITLRQFFLFGSVLWTASLLLHTITFHRTKGVLRGLRLHAVVWGTALVLCLPTYGLTKASVDMGQCLMGEDAIVAFFITLGALYLASAVAWWHSYASLQSFHLFDNAPLRQHLRSSAARYLACFLAVWALPTAVYAAFRARVDIGTWLTSLAGVCWALQGIVTYCLVRIDILASAQFDDEFQQPAVLSGYGTLGVGAPANAVPGNADADGAENARLADPQRPFR